MDGSCAGPIIDILQSGGGELSAAIFQELSKAWPVRGRPGAHPHTLAHMDSWQLITACTWRCCFSSVQRHAASRLCTSNTLLMRRRDFRIAGQQEVPVPAAAAYCGLRRA
jgi:hypothetical protein